MKKFFFSFQKLQRKDYKSLLIQIQQFFTGLMLQFIHVKRFEFMVAKFLIITEFFLSLFLCNLMNNDAHIRYFKLRSFDLADCIVLNIKGLQHRVVKIQGLENLSLWQNISYFNGNQIHSLRNKFITSFYTKVYQKLTTCFFFEK